jgi:hypothetical protein
MASVHRRPASKFWHAFFRDSEGRLVDKSTRLKDRKQAQRVADTLEMAAQREKSAQHVRAAFAQIFQDTYQETMSIATSRSYADQWLETKKAFPPTRTVVLGVRLTTQRRIGQIHPVVALRIIADPGRRGMNPQFLSSCP